MPSPRLALPLLFAAPFLAPARFAAGNSAPAIGEGGLVPHSDIHLTVAREVVRISDTRVIVEYDFHNDVAAELDTELEFPVPDYQNQWDAMDPVLQSFRTLKVWADGKPVDYQTEARAELNGRDVSKILRDGGIDIASFGHLQIGRDQHNAVQRIWVADWERLREKERHHLESDGLFKGGEGYCVYTVHLRYHWMQRFPAHATVHIREEYVPVVGFTEVPADPGAFKAALTPAAGAGNVWRRSDMGTIRNQLGGFCADSRFVQNLLWAQKEFAGTWGQGIVPHWVDFNLTLDVLWHKPIGDFTLIVDIPQPRNGQQTLVSFCPPGVVDKHDSAHPQLHLTNYTPGTDLHVGFFNVPMQSQGEPVAAR
ncbi:MAG: DUF4424 family protein [Terracidiphilus sp.]